MKKVKDGIKKRNRKGSRPFPIDQCKRCRYFRPLNDIGGGYRACLYTFDTGKFRKYDPPDCDVRERQTKFEKG